MMLHIIIIVNDHSESERGNMQLPLQGLLFWLAEKDLLYAPSNRRDSTYQEVCYISYGAFGLEDRSLNFYFRMNSETNSINNHLTTEYKNMLYSYNSILIWLFQFLCFKVALHQIKWLPGQSSRCTIKFIRSECDDGCDWCIYVTVVTCADTLTSTLCIQ